MQTEQETQAIRGLSRTLKRLREPRFGLLDIGIAIAIVVMLLASLFTMGVVLRQQGNIARSSENTQKLVEDLTDLSARFQKAIDAAPAQTARLLEEFSEELRRQIAAHDQRTQQIIVKEGQTRTVVVFVTPSPQPTATVTCNPTPVVGNCPRRR